MIAKYKLLFTYYHEANSKTSCLSASAMTQKEDDG